MVRPPLNTSRSAGEARIAIGSRTLVEHAFEPFRQLRENLKP